VPDEALATREQCGEGARPQGNLVLEDLPERVQRQYAQALGTVSQPGVVGHVREELDSSRDVRAGACDCRPGKHSSSADHHGSSFKSGNAAASDLRVQRVMSSYQNSPLVRQVQKGDAPARQFGIPPEDPAGAAGKFPGREGEKPQRERCGKPAQPSDCALAKGSR